MWYFMAFLGGYGLGILLAAILTAAKRADEWSEAYHQGVEVGKNFERRKEGHWIPNRLTALGDDVFLCSECFTQIQYRTENGSLVNIDPTKMNYCPNCGAKMDEVSDEHTD